MRRLGCAVLALVAPLALIALIAPLTGCAVGGDDPGWTTVRRGELVVGVEVSGALASTESHPLGPPAIPSTWSFKVAMMADEGAEVEAGTPVLAFDPFDLRQQLDTYRNEAESAAKQVVAQRSTMKMSERDDALALAQAEAEQRKAKLKTEGSAEITASIALRKAELDHELAVFSSEIARRRNDAHRRQERAELERLTSAQQRAEQRVAQLQADLASLQVVAPMAGTVLHVVDWQGNKKKIGDNAWRAEKIVEVVSLAHMKAEGEVDEIDSSLVAIGQPVRIELDANADVTLQGSVSSLDEFVQQRAPNDPRKVVKVELSLAAQDEVELRPGMRFRGEVEIARLADVLIIPLSAVEATSEGAIVYRDGAGGAEPVPVELGRRTRDEVEVRGGLSPGDRLRLVDRAGDDGEEPDA